MHQLELLETDILSKLQESKSEFSSEIQSLISISLGEGQYDEVMRVLAELWDDLKQELKSENDMHATTVSTLEQEIETFFTAMNNAAAAKKKADDDYVKFTGEIKTLEKQVAQLTVDILDQES